MPFLYGWQNCIKTAMQTTDNDAYFIFQVIFIPNFIDKPHYVQVLKDKIMVCISGIVYGKHINMTIVELMQFGFLAIQRICDHHTFVLR